MLNSEYIENRLQGLIDCISVYGEVEGLLSFVENEILQILIDISSTKEDK